MKIYKQIMNEPQYVADILNALQKDGKEIAYVIPCHEYDGTLVAIVYQEAVGNSKASKKPNLQERADKVMELSAEFWNSQPFEQRKENVIHRHAMQITTLYQICFGNSWARIIPECAREKLRAWLESSIKSFEKDYIDDGKLKKQEDWQ